MEEVRRCTSEVDEVQTYRSDSDKGWISRIWVRMSMGQRPKSPKERNHRGSGRRLQIRAWSLVVVAAGGSLCVGCRETEPSWSSSSAKESWVRGCCTPRVDTTARDVSCRSRRVTEELRHCKGFTILGLRRRGSSPAMEGLGRLVFTMWMGDGG